MENKKDVKYNPCLFVIFGGTGDLSKRKLIPALYSLFKGSGLPTDFAIVAVAKDEMTAEAYQSIMKSSLEKYTNYELKDEAWDDFCQKLFYCVADFVGEEKGFKKLSILLTELDARYQTLGNRLYYLAVAPEFFEPVIERLKTNGMLENNHAWQRVMVEKPFGNNLEMAKKLNTEILKVLPEEKLFRIDHYLGKEMIQNIIAVRFCNLIFESLWNNQYIDHIQIISTEEIGVENRGSYYEKAGILKDMLQNHILQMLALICMEPPVNLKSESVRDEKVKVLKSLRLFTSDSVENQMVTGQYGKCPKEKGEIVGYRQEKNVSSSSVTPTYVALKTYVDNFRWGGVPIYIKAGKRLDKRETVIVVQFKLMPGTEYFKEFSDTAPDVLVIKVQPSEGIYFEVNAKKPGNEFVIEKVGMDYCQACKYSYNSPEAYERLILEAIRNNSALFTRWDELECSWNYIESIEKSLTGSSESYPNYSSASKGPSAADLLIEKDGRKWWG